MVITVLAVRAERGEGEGILGPGGGVGSIHVKRISVVAPMRNEAAHIEEFVADVAAQDFGGELELIVADGCSTDGSREKLEAAAKKAGLDLTLIDNPAQRIPHGLNACIREASGDLLVRLDCHSRYPSNYLSLCATAAEETGAWSVGGVIVAQGRTPMERAVACAMDTPFGGIGFYRRFMPNDGFVRRLGGAFGIPSADSGRVDARLEVDTATYGAIRPEAFDRVGIFDESLKVDEDEEFNLRVRRAGGRVVLDPSIRVAYTPRGSLRGVFRQYYEYGRWKIPVLVKHSQLPNPRALAPIVFVSSLLILTPTALASSRARRLLALDLALYSVAAFGFGATSLRRRGEDWRLLPRILAVFPAFHVAYGVGMLIGLRALNRRRGARLTS